MWLTLFYFSFLCSSGHSPPKHEYSIVYFLRLGKDLIPNSAFQKEILHSLVK